mmetsp:Transcript_50338/g.168174  ORF Transcript_50338/g.168174 Transcript_50338/m.168174 type:complete len:202 (+) Transcript_50338:92-697(+)
MMAAGVTRGGGRAEVGPRRQMRRRRKSKQLPNCSSPACRPAREPAAAIAAARKVAAAAEVMVLTAVTAVTRATAATIAEGATAVAATAEATVAAAIAEGTLAAEFAEGAVVTAVTAVLKVVPARTDWHWPAAVEAAFCGPSIQTSRCAELPPVERRRERSGNAFSVSHVLGGRWSGYPGNENCSCIWPCTDPRRSGPKTHQ